MKYSFPAFENGFIRAAAASPALRVADCAYNADQIIGVMREYAEKNVQLLCLPEFALTGYTCSDLFLQDTLLRGAEDGLAAILKASEGLNVVVLVGLPVRHNGKLYNCAAVLCNGELLGLVPKVHLPNYGEFYEKRHFISGMRRARVHRAGRAGDADRHEPAVCLQAAARLCAGSRGLRGPVVSHSAELCPRTGRGYRCGKPVRQRRDGRQGSLPPRAGLRAECTPAVRATSTPTQAMARAPPT